MRTKLVAILCLALGATITACLGDPRAKRIEAGEADVNIGSNPRTLDPSLSTDIPSTRAIMCFMRGLTTLDENGKARPELAESWKASKDNTVWVFKLRPAKWTNGDPVTAADFQLRLDQPRPGAPVQIRIRLPALLHPRRPRLLRGPRQGNRRQGRGIRPAAKHGLDHGPRARPAHGHARKPHPLLPRAGRPHGLLPGLRAGRPRNLALGRARRNLRRQRPLQASILRAEQADRRPEKTPPTGTRKRPPQPRRPARDQRGGQPSASPSRTAKSTAPDRSPAPTSTACAGGPSSTARRSIRPISNLTASARSSRMRVSGAPWPWPSTARPSSPASPATASRPPRASSRPSFTPINRNPSSPSSTPARPANCWPRPATPTAGGSPGLNTS